MKTYNRRNGKSITLGKLAALLLFACINVNASASEGQFKPFFELGLNLTPTVNIDGVNIKQQNVTPSFSVGLSKELQLNEDWLSRHSFSLRYSEYDFSGTRIVDNSTINPFTRARHNDITSPIEGDYQALGLWTTLNFTHQPVFDLASPFVEVGLGVINSHRDFDDGLSRSRDRQWKIGYRLATGLSFDIGNKSQLAIAVGYSNDNQR